MAASAIPSLVGPATISVMHTRWKVCCLSILKSNYACEHMSEGGLLVGEVSGR
jgi:hypothetical protein